MALELEDPQTDLLVDFLGAVLLQEASEKPIQNEPELYAVHSRALEPNKRVPRLACEAEVGLPCAGCTEALAGNASALRFCAA